MWNLRHEPRTQNQAQSHHVQWFLAGVHPEPERSGCDISFPLGTVSLLDPVSTQIVDQNPPTQAVCPGSTNNLSSYTADDTAEYQQYAPSISCGVDGAPG